MIALFLMILDIPPGPFEAYLFDCDGTIADSMPLHYVAWQKTLALWGVDFTDELFYATAGTPTTELVAMLNSKFGVRMNVNEVSSLREKHYFEVLPQVRAIPAVRDQIQLHMGKSPLAVVSGSLRESVIKTLTTLDLLSPFKVIVGAEDYLRGKPDPEPFLVAAKRLGVNPTKCLVFEDADLGIQSAEAAGMKWVRVPQN